MHNKWLWHHNIISEDGTSEVQVNLAVQSGTTPASPHHKAADNPTVSSCHCSEQVERTELSLVNSCLKMILMHLIGSYQRSSMKNFQMERGSKIFVMLFSLFS